MKSNVFNGTQPSNDGCTNDMSSDGQFNVDCKQATTLINCDQEFNNDYSDLSDIFAWNRTASGEVSIMFEFDQQINISSVRMLFWNSPSYSIIVPNVMMYQLDHNIQFHEISITTNSPDRTKDGQSALDININDDRLKFQYLKLVMSFYDTSKWIFLSEVQFCGK